MREALLAAGVGEGAIDHRVRQRRLHPFMGGGAYLVGHPDPPPLAREHAALLLGGDRAVLSHQTAAVLWALLKHADGPIHLSLGAQRRNTDHLTFHRAQLMRREVRTLHGDLRVTSPARTIADVAPDLDHETLERVVADAIRRKLTTPAELARHATGRRGARRLRAVLRLDGGAQWTRSRAEQEFLRLVRAASLDAPRANVRVDGRSRDFVFDRQRVIVEVDGRGFHEDDIAFEGDRSRDSGQAARNWLPLRFTWLRMRDEPFTVVAELAAALALRDPLSGR